MAWSHQNFGETTVAEALDASETVITVADGSVFPSSGTFAVVVDDEIMHCTSRSTNDLTVVRGADGTTGVTHDNGAAISQVVTYNSLPGLELDYTQKTSDTTITGTSEGTATTIVTASAITLDGRTTIWIEGYAPFVETDESTDNDFANFVITDGGTVVGRPMSYAANDKPAAGSTGQRGVMFFRHRLTPSAASHTYDIRAFSASGAVHIEAGAGGASTFLPAYIRITVA